MKVRFETKSCSRCGGTGHYSFTPMYGTTCFKCSGTTRQLTKLGIKAKEIYESALTLPVSEINPGMILLTTELNGPRKRREVSSVGPSSSKAMIDGEWIPYTEIRFKDSDMRHNVFATGTVRLALSPDTHSRIGAIAGTPGLTVIHSTDEGMLH